MFGTFCTDVEGFEKFSPLLFSTLLQVWVWEYPTEDGPSHDFYMDPGKEIRFRVTAESFVDTSPTGPSSSSSSSSAAASTPGSAKEGEGGGGGGGGAAGDTAGQQQEEKKIPYLIYGSVNDQGLGVVEWWENA